MQIWNKQKTKLQHPLTALLIATIPQSIMLALVWYDYYVIESLLDNTTRWQWAQSFLPLLIIATLVGSFVIVRWIRGQSLSSFWWPLALISIYSLYTIFYIYNLDELKPFQIPNWMMDQNNLLIYPATFITPVFFYALLLLVAAITPPNLSLVHRLINIGMTIAAPVALYLGAMMMAAIFDALNWRELEDVLFKFMPFWLLGLTLIFFLLLLRSIWILAHTRLAGHLNNRWFQLALLFICGLIFPLLGLLFNNHGELIGLKEMTHIFGDFSHPLYYIIFSINGIALLIPDPRHSILRLMLFVIRISGFSATTYFLLVFIPWMPLSVIAIAILGAGFLMLSPIILFGLQSRILVEDARALLQVFPRWQVIGLGLVALGLWPAVITARNFYDRSQLHAALDYVYKPNYTAPADPDLNQKAIARVLSSVRLFKRSAGTPYLDGYYRSIVLDNLTVSEKKLNLLEQIYLGKVQKEAQIPHSPMGDLRRRRDTGGLQGMRSPRNDLTSLKSLSFETRHKPGEDFYRTRVKLQVQNYDRSATQEYRTQFALPSGVYIRDHYLMIDGRREAGILTEKRAALWTYHRITERRRDPSLLFYREPGLVELRVFPVQFGVDRETGFELIHKAPLNMRIDNHTIRTGQTDLRKIGSTTAQARYAMLPDPSNNVAYKLHILMDCSLPVAETQEASVSREIRSSKTTVVDHSALYLKQLDFIIKEIAGPMQISCVNYGARTTTVNHERFRNQGSDYLRQIIKDLQVNNPRGGLFIGRVMARETYQRAHTQAGILASNARNEIMDRQIFILLAPDSTIKQNRTIFVDNLKSFAFLHAFPYYYHLDPVAINSQGNAKVLPVFPERDSRRQAVLGEIKHDQLLQQIKQAIIASPVRASESRLTIFRPASALAESQGRIMWKDSGELHQTESSEKPPEHLSTTDWQCGMNLEGLYQKHSLHPADNTTYRQLMQESFRCQILTPVTAFIAVENEAQKKALLRKQKETLRAHKALDAEEEPIKMDEPDWLWMLPLLALMLAYVYRLRRKQTGQIA